MSFLSVKFLSLLIICGFLIIKICGESENSIDIKTESGYLRGINVKIINSEKSYYAFKGIPYALPPVGELRFMPPEPIKPWNDTRDALNFGSDCVQPSMVDHAIIGNENCLFLNVYTPDTSQIANLSVMVYIHGGGFYEGSGNDFLLGPDFLLNENVILVTLNYRLGIFGFLALNKSNYTGNMGLKDQYLALKWIKDNIKSFGGDPDKITIMGISAGAASVHYHLINSKSGNLFNRAILISGTAINPWSLNNNSHDDFLLHNYKEMGYINSSNDLINFLKETDADKLVEITPFFIGLQIPFLPNYELGISPFIDETPLLKLQETPVKKHDAMFGFTSHEAYFFINEVINVMEMIKFGNFTITPPLSGLTCSKEVLSNLLNEIKEFYYHNNFSIGDELEKTINLVSDTYFNYGLNTAAKLHAKSDQKTFYYKFSVDGKLNNFKILKNVNLKNGAIHADELCYIFKCRQLKEVYETLRPDSLEYNTINGMVKRLTNFMKYGDPSEDLENLWLPIQDHAVNYLHIGNEGFKPDVNPNGDRNAFWDKHLKDCKITSLIKM